MLAHLRSGESLLPDSYIAVFSLYISRKGKGSLWGLFYKVINLLHEGSTLMTCSPPKGLPPNTITLGGRISIYESGDTQNSAH